MRAPGREARRIRALRPPKPGVDPWRPIDVLREEERLPDGRRVPALTVFLAGSECPFTCVFCDLWRFTLDGPTPPGAIPDQLRKAFDKVDVGPAGSGPGAIVKLYNASNFFDAKAVPPEDDAEIARLVNPFARVVVESHPKLVGRRCLRFAERLDGKLQVAMGLETVHPVLPRLGKQATLDDFRRAAALLTDHGVEMRAFVLIGAPFIPAEELIEWVERSAAYAFEHGAVHVSLIPVRGGNGELERLERAGDFTPPTLGNVEEAVERCLELGTVTV
ncbi:MAG: radical SAM protein, partial [Thermoanaerobaculia bacterium]